MWETKQRQGKRIGQISRPPNVRKIGLALRIASGVLLCGPVWYASVKMTEWLTDLMPQALGVALFFYVVIGVASVLLAAKPNLRSVPIRPIGSRLLTVVGFLFSTRTVRNVFVPVVEDAREEHCEALLRRRGAVFIFFLKVRFFWAFARTLLLQTPLSIFLKLHRLTKGPASKAVLASTRDKSDAGASVDMPKEEQ